MIEGNRLKFGSGDIIIYHDNFGIVYFKQAELPGMIGSSVNNLDTESNEKELSITLSIAKYFSLMRELYKVKKRKKSEFEFDELIFDFNNFNDKSIDICIQEFNIAIRCRYLTVFRSLN